MISGRMRRRALMNQLQTCSTVRPASFARASFSASLGYALYRWSYNHFFRILIESLGRLPRLLLAAALLPAPHPRLTPSNPTKVITKTMTTPPGLVMMVTRI